MRSRERVASCQNRRIHVAQPPPAVCREAAIDVGPPADHSRGRLCRTTGFTLIEMLVVMGIIVLALTLAIPTIRALTGSKSLQASQNTVAAAIATARADAVGTQDVEGVLFYVDPNSGRIACQEVAQSPAQTTDIAGVVYLDLVGGVHPSRARDPLFIPPGIAVMTCKDTTPVTSPPSPLSDPYSTSGGAQLYLGYNIYSGATVPLGGAILFDGSGRVYTGAYGFRFHNVTTGLASQLGQLAFNGGTPTVDWPGGSSGSKALWGQLAFVLFDREAFLNQAANGSNFRLNNDDGSTNANPAALAQDGWLNLNTTPIFVSRTNGALMQAE